MEYLSSYRFDNLVVSPFHIVNRFCDVNWYVPYERKDFHNIMLIISGEGIAKTEGTEHLLTSGTLIYHSPGENYGVDTSKTHLMHCFGVNVYIHSTACTMGKWTFEPVERLPFDNYMKISDMPLLTKLFTNLSEVWQEARKNYLLKCRSILMNIIYELSRQAMLQKGNIKIIQNIELITTYIRQNYQSNLTLELISDLIDLNPSYLGNIFKKYMGQTPMEYVNAVRIQKAEEFLNFGYTISETASLVGINDPFYFSKVFKKYNGVCPREYKKQSWRFC